MNRFAFKHDIRLLFIVVLFLGTTFITFLGASHPDAVAAVIEHAAIAQ